MRPPTDRRFDPAGHDSSRRSRAVGRLRGALAGLVAFAVTAGVFQVLARATYPGAATGAVETARVGAPTVGGWLFFAAHGVPVTLYEYCTPGDCWGAPTPLEFAGMLGADPVPYLVPALALLGAGVAVDRIARPDAAGRALLDGATVAIGYAVPVAALAVAVQKTSVPDAVSEPATFYRGGPELPAAILLAGVAYPVVVAGLGSLGSYAVRLSSAAGGAKPALLELASRRRWRPVRFVREYLGTSNQGSEGRRRRGSDDREERWWRATDGERPDDDGRRDGN